MLEALKLHSKNRCSGLALLPISAGHTRARNQNLANLTRHHGPLSRWVNNLYFSLQGSGTAENSLILTLYRTRQTPALSPRWGSHHQGRLSKTVARRKGFFFKSTSGKRFHKSSESFCPHHLRAHECHGPGFKIELLFLSLGDALRRHLIGEARPATCRRTIFTNRF